VDSLIANLLPELHLSIDKRFRDEFAYEDISTISQNLANHGYPYAEVKSDLTVDTAANRVDIAWGISTGPRSYFGTVNIEGNQRVSSDLIRKYVAFEPGHIFRQRKLDATQRDLIHLSLFEVATTVADLTGDQSDTIPVTVRLRESPWFSTKFGAGYGTEDKFRLFTESRLLGILGEARILTLFAKHSDLEPYHVRAHLTQPGFLTKHTHLTIGPFIRRQDEPGFDLSRYGIKATIDHYFNMQTSTSIGYTFERIHIDTGEVAETDPGSEGLDDYYNKSSILLGFTYDNSNPDHSPSRGIFSALTFKFSGLDLGSDYHFTRTLMDLRHYQAALGMVLATRVHVGGIHSYDDDEFVPIEDRFFAGGSSSVRGWARAKLGPRDEEGTPIGGKSLIVLSAEFRYPIIGILSGVIFTDAGNVWYDEFFYRINELRYSAGLGIRVATPIGPIRLDAAQPIFDSEDTIQLHLSVGQAF
jgi:outer membrane protein insertion porin family